MCAADGLFPHLKLEIYLYKNKNKNKNKNKSCSLFSQRFVMISFGWIETRLVIKTWILS